jgi:hypothetical protein
MKTRFLFLMVFVANYIFSQSVNDYKAVIIPVKYDFLRTENQYRLQTLTKFGLEKAGFKAFYSNELIPSEFNDRCSVLYIDVKNTNAFLITKFFITFKDCYGTLIFQSAIGKSKEKDFEVAFAEALNDAFKSVCALNYKYNGNTKIGTKSGNISESVSAVVVPVLPINKAKKESEKTENEGADLLYAQPTSYGFQLIDSKPKVVMKVYKTSNPTSFIATKENIQGVLVSKDNLWFFEYYQNEQLISEKINVKF